MADKFSLFIVKDIIANPIKAWERIDSENRSVKIIRNCFLFPVLLLISLSAFAGSLLYTNATLSSVYSIFAGIKCFLLFYITIYATAFILKEITYPLDLGRSFSVSFRLITYSVVPFLFCQLISRFFESLLFINVLALYSLYIFWTGSERMLTPQVHKKMPLLIATLVTFTGIFAVTNILLTMLLDRIYFKFFS
jgi:hypothetical protein